MRIWNSPSGSWSGRTDWRRPCFWGRWGWQSAGRISSPAGWTGFAAFLCSWKGREQAEAQTCLAASEYLVLRFGGVHQDAASYYRQMLAYLSERGYRLAGDSVEIALIDGGITGDEAQFVTELQIPFSR